MLIHRLITGSILIGVLVVSAFWDSPVAGVLFTLMGVSFLFAALREYFSMVTKVGERVSVPINGFSNLCIFCGVLLLFSIGGLGYLAHQSGNAEWQHRLSLTVETLTTGGFLLLAFILCF